MVMRSRPKLHVSTTSNILDRDVTSANDYLYLTLISPADDPSYMSVHSVEFNLVSII